MVELVIEFVYLYAPIMIRLQWPDFLVGIFTRLTKAPKQPHHAKLHFPVTVVTGRIKNYGFTL